MAYYWISGFIFRIVFPSLIIFVLYLRPTITTYIYLLMALYMPFFSVPSPVSMARETGVYVKMFVVVSLLTSLSVFGLFFILFFPRTTGYEIENCSFMETALRTYGVIQFRDLPSGNTAIQWLLPEPLMLVSGLVLLVIFRKLNQESRIRTPQEIEEDEIKEIHNKELVHVFSQICMFIWMLLLCFCAVIRISPFGGLYYFLFLSFLTYWAMNKRFGRACAKIVGCISSIIFIHITLLYAYQFQPVQDKANVPHRLIRILQVHPFRKTASCNDPRIFLWIPHRGITNLLPAALYALYSLSVLLARHILKAHDGVLPFVGAIFRRSRERGPAGKWIFMIRRIKENIEEKRVMTYLEDEHKAINKLKYVIEQFMLFTMSVSYVMANFTMLVWSIIFVTQRGLVLFIWANLIWIIPNGKAAMLKSSPFLVGFLWLHLGLLYTYSSKLTRSLFIDSVWYFRLSAGTDVSDMAWVHLLIQSTFGILVFCAMRQYFHEKRRKKAKQQLAEIMGARSRFNMVLSRSVVLTTTAGFLWKWLALIWIWMVVMLMIWMEFWGTSNAFRIMFVALAIFLVMTFQLCSFEFWKKSLRIYWWFLIGYAMANFVTFYLYESGMTRRLLLQYVSTEEQFYKFGLERHKYSERYKPLLNPLFFQLAIIIQKNYLQETFDKYTSPLKENEYKRRKNNSPWMKFMYYTILMKNLVFQTLCVHFQKILLLLGWFVCVYDMCAFNMVFAILLTVSCFSGRNFAFKIIYIMSAWNQVLIVLRLLYMNLYTSHRQWDYVGHYTRNGIEYNITLNNAKWLGFQESRLGYRYADFYKVAWSFLFVAAVTLFRVVQIRQVNYRLARNLPTKRPDVIFPGIDYQNCHYSSWNMLKYIANFGFYKLGVEISAVFASIVLFIRMDIFSILISLILIGMCTVKRKYKRMVWFIILIGMAFLLPFQYFMTLGICPAYWDISLTRYWNENNTRLRLQQFLNQMNLVYPPKAMLLLFDFVLFMCVARQWRAFKTEKKFAQRDFPGGSNEEVYHLIDDPTVVNPVPDYVSNTRTSLDIYKYVIFSSSYYVSLLFTFLAGTMRPTFYSFGYILFASMLAWEGRDMFLRPPKGIIFRWNLLICYNILIMLLRSISQIFGCVIIHNITPAYCSIFQILSLGCVDKLGSYSISGLDDHSHCDLEKGGLGAGWDTACFVFLILQQRVFKSYYFFHIVNDVKAETIIADRGASIIETVMAKKKEQIKKQNKSIKDNMDFKMKKIRLNAKNIAAIRGGDYRSFDQTERNLNIPLLPQTGPDVDPDFDPTDPMACSEFLALLIKTNAFSVLEERKYRQQMKQYLKDKVANKKASMPKKPVPGEPRPSTTEESEHVKGKIMTYLLLLWSFFESVIVSLTSLFNWGTPLFRQIRSEISSEKNMLKKNPYNLVGERLGRSKIWSPTKTLETIEKENFSPKKPDIPQYDVGVRLSEDEFLKRKGFVMDELLKKQKFAFSIYTKLVRAFLFTLLNYSEWLCYTCIIARHVYRSDFLSLPLLIMVFCWGSLTMPKPSKTFWIVVIAYVLITLLIQSFFVMDIADWNALRFENNIFYPPNIIGLQRNLSTSFAIAMLASLFFHRAILQLLGLWKPYVYRSTKLIQDGEYFLQRQKLVSTPNPPNTASKKVYTIESTDVKLGDYFPQSVMHGAQKYGESVKSFLQQLLTPSTTQVPVDVYTPMFFCDLINLFNITFFFDSFMDKEEKHGLIGFLMTNKVPMSFIVTFLLQFGMMVVDRWIYKGKRRFIKTLFHFFQVFTYHIWFFIIYPMVTLRVFSETPAVQTFYVTKCMYFLFSAYQIRNGYPMLISMHFLWHRYTTFNRFAFKFYTLIPYVFELRTLLDWTITDTCLGVSQYFKMEDITENIYDQMCEREFEKLTSSEESSGKRKKRPLKYALGCVLFVLLTFSLILPFLIFAMSGTVGVTTHPPRMRLSLYLGTMQPIYVCVSDALSMTVMSHDDFKNISRTFNNIQTSKDIFDKYEPEDVAVVKWTSYSSENWDISPKGYTSLIDQVKTFDSFTARLVIEYVHESNSEECGKEEKIFEQTSAPFVALQREALVNMMVSETATEPLWIPLIFPKFISIDKDGIPESVPLMEPLHGDEKFTRFMTDENDETVDELTAGSVGFRHLLIGLQRENGQSWWEIQESCEAYDQNYQYYLKDLVHNSCKEPTIYVFNDKVFSSTVSYITGSGILGMYLIYFMIILSVLRDMTIKADEIWIEDIDHPENLMRKCLEVYLARDMENFELEQELFEELIFIMRSREICIKLSREEET